MGISGLLPLLKSIHKHCTLKKYAGQTIGVDAYGWLHRGAVACALELALDKPTTKYVDFAVSRVRMLLDFGVVPYLVFDGDALPSKSGTNTERRKRREESKTLGLELYRSGKVSQAYQELQKAVPVTPYMARLLIEELKRMNVQYVVAPYEADAQLAYLEQKGIINGILSEDSDLLVFGAKRLLTKLNQYGECIEIERADFALCKEISLVGWTDAMFRRMAVLSGCDYLPNIDKMGLKTAYRYVRKYREADKIIRMLQFEGKFVVPTDYVEKFQQAELTFLHHRVFCPTARKLVFLNDLAGRTESDMPYIGCDVDSEVATAVACGDLDPKTKQPIKLPKSNPTDRPALGANRRQTLASTADLKPNKSLESFFTIKRQPLAELDPNSLTPSPSQQRLLDRNRNASWEPRMVSSAPQLRRAATGIIGTSTSSRTMSTNTDRAAFLARASTISTYQPPKRQRLCSEAESTSSGKGTKDSPFFARSDQESPLAQRKTRTRKARKSGFDVWSDDSIDDATFLELPDVQKTTSPAHRDDTSLSQPIEQARVSEDMPSVDAIPQSPTGNATDSVNTSEKFNLSAEFDFRVPAPNTTAMGSDVPDNENVNVEDSFVDLLEMHYQEQTRAMLRTFSYQSSTVQKAALDSLQSPTPDNDRSAESDRKSNTTSAEGVRRVHSAASVDSVTYKASQAAHPKTFQAQSPAQQLTALKSLRPVQSDEDKINLGRAALATAARAGLVQPNLPSLGALWSYDNGHASQLPRQSVLIGSEDFLVPNSEDEDSGVEENDLRPRLDLSAFAFVPT